LLALTSATSWAQDSAHAAAQNIADMHFVQIPGMPTCATGSVRTGDPAKGPSIILAKMAAGCTFPWHWHTPVESVMMVKGSGRVEMKDAKPVTLAAGGFAQMPSRHVHQFGCAKGCMLYVSSDAAFDMHYVDGDGKEISPEDALKKLGEKAFRPPN
jgi:quercetin dioxygenase-like cupin family protein